MTERLNWKTAQTFLYSPLITDTQIRTQTNMHLDLHPRKAKFRDLGYMYHILGDKRSPCMYTNICSRGKLHLILRNRHLKIKNKCDQFWKLDSPIWHQGRQFSSTNWLQIIFLSTRLGASLLAQRLKCLPGMQETQLRSLGREDPLEKEMATHYSTPAWKIPWTEEPGGLQSMGMQRVGHDWAASLHY